MSFHSFVFGQAKVDIKKLNNLFWNGNYKEVILDYATLYNQDRFNQDINFKYGTCLLFTSDSLSKLNKAIGHLTFACASDNALAEYHFYLGRALHFSGNFQGAIKNFELYKTKSNKSTVQLPADLYINYCAQSIKLNEIARAEFIKTGSISPSQIGISQSLNEIDLSGKFYRSSEFQTKVDKKRNFAPLIYKAENSTVKFFSSYGDKDEGHKDIYIVTGSFDDKKIQRLPSVINTIYEEDNPVYDEVTNYLYFSSLGHNSSGGYDLFRSKYDIATNEFSAPENLGKGISSSYDDLFFIYNSKNNKAFLNSNKLSLSGELSIYQGTVSFFDSKDILPIAVNIQFNNGGNSSIKLSEITVRNTSNDSLVSTFQSLSTDRIQMKLDPGTYLFNIQLNGSKDAFEAKITIPKNGSEINQTIEYSLDELNNEQVQLITLTESENPELLIAKNKPKGAKKNDELTVVNPEAEKDALKSLQMEDYSQSEVIEAVTDKIVEIELTQKENAELIDRLNSVIVQNKEYYLELQKEIDSISLKFDEYTNIEKIDKLKNIQNILAEQDEVKKQTIWLQQLNDSIREDQIKNIAAFKSTINLGNELLELVAQEKQSDAYKKIIENPNKVTALNTETAFEKTYNQLLDLELELSRVDKKNISVSNELNKLKDDLTEIEISLRNATKKEKLALEETKLTTEQKILSKEKQLNRLKLDKEELSVLKSDLELKRNILSSVNKEIVDEPTSFDKASKSYFSKKDDSKTNSGEISNQIKSLEANLRPVELDFSAANNLYTTQKESIIATEDQENQLIQIEQEYSKKIEQLIVQEGNSDTSSFNRYLNEKLQESLAKLTALKEDQNKNIADNPIVKSDEEKQADENNAVEKQDQDKQNIADNPIVKSDEEKQSDKNNAVEKQGLDKQNIADNPIVKSDEEKQVNKNNAVEKQDRDKQNIADNPIVKTDEENQSDKNNAVEKQELDKQNIADNPIVKSDEEKQADENNAVEKQELDKQNIADNPIAKSEEEKQADENNAIENQDKNQEIAIIRSNLQSQNLPESSTDLNELNIQDLTNQTKTTELKKSTIYQDLQGENPSILYFSERKQLQDKKILEYETREIEQLIERENGELNKSKNKKEKDKINSKITGLEFTLAEKKEQINQIQEQINRQNETLITREDFTELTNMGDVEQNEISSSPQYQKYVDAVISFQETEALIKSKKLNNKQTQFLLDQEITLLATDPNNESAKKNINALTQAIEKNQGEISLLNAKLLEQKQEITKIETANKEIQSQLRYLVKNKIEPIQKISIVPKNEIIPNSGFVINSNQESNYSINNPIPLDVKAPSGLVYRVQVGAFRKPIPPNLYAKFNPVSGEVSPTGLTLYMAGYFNSAGNAVNARKQIQQLGYSDAFVVAYCNGKKITLGEARQLEARGECVPNKSEQFVLEIANNTKEALQLQKGSTTALAINTPSNTQNSSRNLYFTVQIGVYNQFINEKVKFPSLTEIGTNKIATGQIRYSTGKFKDVNTAKERKDIAVGSGIKDAFIVAYFNGERITIAAAKELLSTYGDSILQSNPTKESINLEQISYQPSSKKYFSPEETKIEPVRHRYQSKDEFELFPADKIAYYNQFGLFQYNPESKKIESLTFTNESDLDNSIKLSGYLSRLDLSSAVCIAEINDDLSGDLADFILRSHSVKQISSSENIQIDFEKTLILSEKYTNLLKNTFHLTIK